MPGIHDAHTHFLWASMLQKYGCMLKDGETVDGIVSELKQCARGRRKDEWLVAGPYTYTSFPENRPHRKWLDQAFPDTPVYIREYSFHQVLLNTRALQITGIDSNTPNPERGEIVKDDNGELTGELVEEAVLLAQRFLPPDTAKQQLEALRWAVKVNNQYGITSIQEAATSLAALRGLDTLDRGSELTLEVAAHLTWGSPRFGEASNEELDALIDNRAKYQTQRVRTDFVKITLDGVPIPPLLHRGRHRRSLQRQPVPHPDSTRQAERDGDALRQGRYQGQDARDRRGCSAGGAGCHRGCASGESAILHQA